MSHLVGLVGSVDTTRPALSQVEFISTCEYDHYFDVRLDGVTVAVISEDVWSDKPCWDVEVNQKILGSFCTKEEAFGFARERFSKTHQQAQKEIEQCIEQQAEVLTPEFEIDSEKDEDFGEFFRVWCGRCFIGSFYQALDGKWTAQPVGGIFSPKLNSSDQAQLVIIAFYYACQGA